MSPECDTSWLPVPRRWPFRGEQSAGLAWGCSGSFEPARGLQVKVPVLASISWGICSALTASLTALQEQLAAHYSPGRVYS